MEDQVYNGIDDYLRYVRRWVKLLGHAADRELDQGVRLARSGTSGWPAATAARSSARPGPARSTSGPAASPSPPTNARSAPPGARTSATTSPASPPTSPSGAPARASARAASTPTCRARGRLPLDGRVADRRSTTRPSSCCASTPRSGQAVVVHVDGAARDRGRPGPGRPDRQRAPRAHVVTPLDFKPRRRHADACAWLDPAASAASPRSSSTPTPAPTASAPAGSTGAT